jgi:MFS family permease
VTIAEAQELTPSLRERIYRRNFVFFLGDSVLFTIAIGILGATTVVPDFVRRLTDSEVLIGIFSSLFNIGFLLPQLFVARYIVRYERKKWWFVGPNIPVRFVILIFAGVAVWLGKDQPQFTLLAFFICMAIAAFGDGLVGVPWADLAGTSLDHRWRARFFGLTTVITSIILLLVAPFIGLILGDPNLPFPNNYALLFAISGVLFALSILPGLFFHELPGGKALVKRPSLGEFLPDLGRVLRDDGPFRAIVITRTFTSLFMMAAPFYVGYATVDLGLSSEVAVPGLLAMQTIGNIGGALNYTWLGARNNLLYIRLALAGAALLPVAALLAGVFGPTVLYAGFLVFGFASGNLFNGYLNWIVGYATPERRPVYVGLFNTIAAVSTFAAPIIGGTLAQSLGYRPLFVVSLVMALGALTIALRFLPSTQPAPAAAA